MRHPREILLDWSGYGKLPDELTKSEVDDLRKRIGECNAWLKGRIEELVREGSSVRDAVMRATNESGMSFSADDQKRMIEAGEKAREFLADAGKPLVEIVSASDFEKEKIRAEREGDLIMQAKRVR